MVTQPHRGEILEKPPIPETYCVDGSVKFPGDVFLQTVGFCFSETPTESFMLECLLEAIVQESREIL